MLTQLEEKAVRALKKNSKSFEAGKRSVTFSSSALMESWRRLLCYELL